MVATVAGWWQRCSKVFTSRKINLVGKSAVSRFSFADAARCKQLLLSHWSSVAATSHDSRVWEDRTAGGAISGSTATVVWSRQRRAHRCAVYEQAATWVCRRGRREVRT